MEQMYMEQILNEPNEPIEAKEEKTTPKPTKKKNKARTQKAPSAVWSFPKNNLEEAIKIPKAIEEQNAGNPMKADMLVRAVGFKKPSDWRFLDLLRSANLYGLVEGSGASAQVSMTNIGSDVVTPGSPVDRQKALLKAFRQVEDFKKVEIG